MIPVQKHGINVIRVFKKNMVAMLTNNYNIIIRQQYFF